MKKEWKNVWDDTFFERMVGYDMVDPKKVKMRGEIDFLGDIEGEQDDMENLILIPSTLFIIGEKMKEKRK